MDTDKLNHELQIFRNHVKIARENIIHKLVRDIKFWKAKHETNANNKRAAKKIESLVALMGHIKVQPASLLTKAIIRFNPKKSDNGNQSMEVRALMRFHENKKLLPELRALIRRFGLNSKMEVLDKYLKKRKDDEKKSSGVKQSKKRKKLPNVKQEVEEPDSEDQGFCETVRKHNESSSESETVDDENQQETGMFVQLIPAQEKVMQKKSRVEKYKKSEKERKDVFRSPAEDGEDKCVQIQDNFFVTSSGQSYVAIAPAIDQKQQQQEMEEEFSWKRANKRKDILGNRGERAQKRPYKIYSDEDNEVYSTWNSKQQQKGVKQFNASNRRSETQSNDSDLHPSWAAKQKQRGIQNFVGIRKKFESSETQKLSSVEDLHPSWAAKQKEKGLKSFQGKKIIFDSSEQEQSVAEDVHPSWAAKQKQKGLKPFQGKKIVFDATDDRSENAVSSAPPTDLHPSWAAKQKEKGIKEFRGKKITFDD